LLNAWTNTWLPSICLTPLAFLRMCDWWRKREDAI
jgi:hypothetical protein